VELEISLSYSNGLPLDHLPTLLYVAKLIIIQSSLFGIVDFYVGIRFRESGLAASVLGILAAWFGIYTPHSAWRHIPDNSDFLPYGYETQIEYCLLLLYLELCRVILPTQWMNWI
jgi:hypothetical protein